MVDVFFSVSTIVMHFKYPTITFFPKTDEIWGRQNKGSMRRNKKKAMTIIKVWFQYFCECLQVTHIGFYM